MRRSIRQQGFTLIELLLATSLVAFIMLMAYNGLQASIKLTDAGESFIDRSSRARLAHEFLRKQLSRMLPLAIKQDSGRNINFEGESDRMMWVGPMPGYLGRGGPYVQELTLKRESDGTVLYFRYAMLNGYEEDSLEDVDPVALIEGIDRAKFEFQAVDSSGKVGSWNSSWEKKDNATLPLMVRMEISMRKESRMQVPALIVPVVVDGNLMRSAPQDQLAGAQQ